MGGIVSIGVAVVATNEVVDVEGGMGETTDRRWELI